MRPEEIKNGKRNSSQERRQIGQISYQMERVNCTCRLWHRAFVSWSGDEPVEMFVDTIADEGRLGEFLDEIIIMSEMGSGQTGNKRADC